MAIIPICIDLKHEDICQWRQLQHCSSNDSGLPHISTSRELFLPFLLQYVRHFLLHCLVQLETRYYVSPSNLNFTIWSTILRFLDSVSSLVTVPPGFSYPKLRILTLSCLCACPINLFIERLSRRSLLDKKTLTLKKNVPWGNTLPESSIELILTRANIPQ